MLGDYTMRPDPRPLEERKPLNIDKDNFQKVMSEQKLALNFAVNLQRSLTDDLETLADDLEIVANDRFRTRLTARLPTRLRHVEGRAGAAVDRLEPFGLRSRATRKHEGPQ